MAKHFRDLKERELLALAISQEEEDGRIYGEFAEGLRRQHDIAMRDLYYGSDPPTFDDVIERVHASAELLNPKR